MQYIWISVHIYWLRTYKLFGVQFVDLKSCNKRDGCNGAVIHDYISEVAQFMYFSLLIVVVLLFYTFSGQGFACFFFVHVRRSFDFLVDY